MPVSIWLPIAVLGAVTLALVVRTWWKWRGDRVVQCPENHRPAGVVVAAGRAALNPFQAPSLSSCSRWPEHANCGQECLTQVHMAPGDCLVRNILLGWYAGKQCACCGKPFESISAVGAMPAVLCADRKSVEWGEIPAERLQETLEAAKPICFACHMGNTLVRQHPELVVDRHRMAERSGRP